MPSILFLSSALDSAPTQARAIAYFDLLHSHGWEPQHITIQRGLLNKTLLLASVRQADVVVILRKIIRQPFLKLLRANSRCLIYDFDDAIFMRDNGQPCKRRMQQFAMMLNHCHLAWAGNHYLKFIAETMAADVSYIPTSVNMAEYQQPQPKPTDSFDLVWIGSSSTKKYLVDIIPILETLAQTWPELRLKIIADFTLETRYLEVLPIQWTPDTQAQHLATSHVGIAPMIDDPWTRGKCAFKVIQCMAAGLPVITSPVGVNKEVVVNGITGFHADNLEEWKQALIQLRDASCREQMGNASRERIQTYYSTTATFTKIIADLDRLLVVR